MVGGQAGFRQRDHNERPEGSSGLPSDHEWLTEFGKVALDKHFSSDRQTDRLNGRKHSENTIVVFP